MTWRNTIREAINDNESGLASSTRIAVLLATTTLSFCTLILTFASVWKIELVPALSVLGGGLAGVAGGSYMTQRLTSPRKEWTPKHGSGRDYDNID